MANYIAIYLEPLVCSVNKFMDELGITSEIQIEHSKLVYWSFTYNNLHCWVSASEIDEEFNVSAICIFGRLNTSPILASKFLEQNLTLTNGFHYSLTLPDQVSVGFSNSIIMFKSKSLENHLLDLISFAEECQQDLKVAGNH